MIKKIFFSCLFLVILSCYSFAADKAQINHTHKIGPILAHNLRPTLPPSPNFLAATTTNTEELRAVTPKLVKVIVSIDHDYLSELPPDLVDELSYKVESLGGHIGQHAYNNVQVWLPYDAIEILALWSKIKHISAPIVSNQTGTSSEGLPYIGATDWQKIGVTGRGVNVAVIDLGFKGYSALLGTELPATVDAYYFGDLEHFYSNVHGTACAEIVHDVAPDASLALLDAGDMRVGFHQAVSWMKNNDIDVTSSSIGINLKWLCSLMYWVLHGPSFSQDYFISQLDYLLQTSEQVESTVKSAVHGGLTWAQSAGNDGQKKWSGWFWDRDGDGYLNFSATEDYNTLYTQGCEGQEVYVLLMWGEGGISYSDYDLKILDTNFNIVARSDTDQMLLPVGVEACRFTPRVGVNYRIAINKYSGYNQSLDLFVGHDDFPNLKYFTKTSTVMLTPPAPVAEAITVGAVDMPEATVAPYSSQGPGENGVMKPDVVAPAGVQTASYGDRAFNGTSAAAPHVAGLCALLKQRYPDASPVQIKSFLKGTAVDLGPAGPDNTYGSGLAYLPISIFSQAALYFPCTSSSPGNKNTVGIVNTEWPLNLFGKLMAFNSLGNELGSKDVAIRPKGRQEFSAESLFPNMSNISYYKLDYLGGKACGYISSKSADLRKGYILPAVDNGSSGEIFIPHISSDDIWNTEFSLLNTNIVSKNISLKFDNGTVRNFLVAPKEQKRFKIRDFFNGVPQPDIHSAKLSGTSGFVGAEVFIGGNYAAGITLEPNIQKNIYSPYVVNDKNWWTGLVAYNPSKYAANFSIFPFSSDGVPLPTKVVSLPGESQYVGTPDSLALPPETAWFKIESSTDMNSFELFGTTDGRMMSGYSTTGIATAIGVFPKLYKNGDWTGIAMINPNAEPTNVYLFAYDDSGSIVDFNAFALAAHDQIVDMAEVLFSYGNDDREPANLETATHITFNTFPNKVIGFQVSGSANGMTLESIPALSPN